MTLSDAEIKFSSLKDFNKYIDSKIKADEVLQSRSVGSTSWIDLMNLEEESRVELIKKIISYTHIWQYCTVIDRGFKIECMWCQKCGIRASIFDKIGYLSIITKVRDRLPTYSTHNQYLMYPCDHILKFKDDLNGKSCISCGLPEMLAGELCEIA